MLMYFCSKHFSHRANKWNPGFKWSRAPRFPVGIRTSSQPKAGFSSFIPNWPMVGHLVIHGGQLRGAQKKVHMKRIFFLVPFFSHRIFFIFKLFDKKHDLWQLPALLFCPSKAETFPVVVSKASLRCHDASPTLTTHISGSPHSCHPLCGAANCFHRSSASSSQSGFQTRRCRWIVGVPSAQFFLYFNTHLRLWSDMIIKRNVVLQLAQS